MHILHCNKPKLKPVPTFATRWGCRLFILLTEAAGFILIVRTWSSYSHYHIIINHVWISCYIISNIRAGTFAIQTKFTYSNSWFNMYIFSGIFLHVVMFSLWWCSLVTIAFFILISAMWIEMREVHKEFISEQYSMLIHSLRIFSERVGDMWRGG